MTNLLSAPGRRWPVMVLVCACLVASPRADALEVKATQNTVKMMPYQVFEITFQHEGRYKNPTWDVTIEVAFTSPTGKRISVGGFFYGSSKPQQPLVSQGKTSRGTPAAMATWPCDPADIYKARFAPVEVGDWSFAWTLKNPAGQAATGSGRFSVTRGRVAQRGFLRISPDNPYRFIFDDGSPFWPIGYQDGVGDWDHSGSCMDGRGVEGPFRLDPEGKRHKLPDGPLFRRGPGWGPVSGDFDFGRHARAGFNLWRISPNNNTMKVFYGTGQRRYPGLDEVDWKEAQFMDETLMMSRKHGFVNLYGIFGFTGAGNQKPPGERDMDKVRRIIKYSVDRWGAYVDFWEFLNEQKADTDWYAATIPHLKSIDPYRHIVTTSWERPEIEGIDVSAPHWYVTEDELASVEMMGAKGRAFKKFPKPVVFGEQGNRGSRETMGVGGWGGVWDPLSARRMRARLWSALFNELALVFWETSYARDGHYMNLWIGPEERQYVKALSDFIAKLDRDVKMFAPDKQGPQAGQVHALGLRSGSCVAVYLFHNRCEECRKGHGPHPPEGKPVWLHERGDVKDLKVTVEVPRALKGYWYDPATAAILGRFDAPAGRQIFAAPGFKIDLAMILSDKEPVDSDGDGQPNDHDDDDDNDSVSDAKDAWPLERDEQADTDGDRIGDHVDADFDGDGVADDRNRDGVPDSEEKDWDGDGVLNRLDAFPFDPKESRDTDGDGIGDNTDADKDGDGYSDAEEKTAGTDPLNPLNFP